MLIKPFNRIFPSLLLITSTLFASEDSLIEQLQKKYQDISHYQANFTQTKKVSYISKPLITTGSLEFALGEGLIWQIIKPLWTKTLINDRGVYKTTKYQKNQKVNDIQIKIVAEIMTELLTANLNKIESHFEISAVTKAQDQSNWTIQLLPKKALMKKAIKQIDLIGESRLNDTGLLELIDISQIQITDKSNNLTHIQLIDIKLSSGLLSPQVKARFE